MSDDTVPSVKLDKSPDVTEKEGLELHDEVVKALT